jgi:hypothetical protein
VLGRGDRRRSDARKSSKLRQAKLQEQDPPDLALLQMWLAAGSTLLIASRLLLKELDSEDDDYSCREKTSSSTISKHISSQIVLVLVQVVQHIH